MKYHKQLFKHDPDNGVYGDCYRTCIACLLDLEPTDVPHFMYGVDSDDDAAEVRQSVNVWLAKRGLIMVSVGYNNDDIDLILKCMSFWNPGVYYMLGGTSPRGVNHQVIAYEDKIIHDPSHDGGGLTGPCDDGNIWIDFLAARLV